MSTVNNEHIVKYYESFYSRNSYNIVMEFCDGTDLNKYIDKHKREHKRIEKDVIYGFILDISEGLKEIHSKNIIHKDIKPDNLFLTNKGIIKIGDFGISRQLYNSRDFANTCNGPLLYMAPEEIEKQHYNTKVDIWALGCVIHELCTLDICFKDYQSILHGRYGRIDTNFYGNFLQNLIDLLLNQDYHKRPKASEIIDIVNSKHIPNEFQRNNNSSHDFNSNFAFNTHHHSRISHRTSTIPHNGSHRNIFRPFDDNNIEHPSSFMNNRQVNFSQSSPLSHHSMAQRSPNFGHTINPNSIPPRSMNSGFPPFHPMGPPQVSFGPSSPLIMNGPTRFVPPPPNPFNTHGPSFPPPIPFNANRPSPPPPSFSNVHGPYPPPSSGDNCIIF